MEQIMEMVEGAKKGRMMNIKENYYIYQFNHFNKLIQEQKHTKESHNQNSLFDITVRYQHTATSPSLNTP
jgi:negative regulator of genetic competence, sporulation and motility